jgi:hypothetical protein
VNREASGAKTKSPFLLGIGFSLIPNFIAESPTPKRVGYTLPKMEENGKFDERSDFFFKIGRL